MTNTEHLFARDDIAPSWWANALNKFLGVASDNFVLSLLNLTTIQVIASANDGAAAIAVKGRWRINEATVSRPHPGGAAGTYDIYVTAANNNIVGTPDPFTDATNYAFGLSIVASGATPPIAAGTVDVFRKVGTCQWSGSVITGISQTVPSSPQASAHYLPGDLIISAAAARADAILCDHRAVSRTGQVALFAAIGTTYGAGDGSTTFNVPDCRGRTIMGAGLGSGLTNRVLGALLGVETHTHVVPNLALFAATVAHHHPLSGAGGALIRLFNDVGGGVAAFAQDTALDTPGETFPNYQRFNLGPTTQVNVPQGLNGVKLGGQTDDLAAGVTGAALSAPTNSGGDVTPSAVVNIFIKT